LTVAEILAAIELLPEKEQQELSQAVLNLPINIQPKYFVWLLSFTCFEKEKGNRAVFTRDNFSINY
jgi:hypothetical protein